TPAEAVPATNAVAAVGAYNGVDHVLAGMQPLELSSEDRTGIKIPPGQIAGGAIVLRDGEAADLDIDFDACRSIVPQPNGTFRLGPTLHVGEVMLNRDVVTGRVVDFATGQPLAGASTMVLVETPDADGVDRVVRQAWADPTTGTFEFCPVPAGAYDVVVSAGDLTRAPVGPPVTFGGPTGTAMGDVPLVRVAATGTTLAEVRGFVETSPMPSDVEVSVLQSATPAGGTARFVTVPLLADSESSLE